MSLTPPPGISLLDLWLFNLVCSQPQCGHRFKEILRQLKAHDAIPCPHCSRSVNLIPYKRAIEEAVRMATEDDRFGKDDQIDRHWQPSLLSDRRKN
jgi:hypothetical protein